MAFYHKLIAALDQGPATIPQLAALLAVPPQRVNTEIYPLVHTGYAQAGGKSGGRTVFQRTDKPFTGTISGYYPPRTRAPSAPAPVSRSTKSGHVAGHLYYHQMRWPAETEAGL